MAVRLFTCGLVARSRSSYRALAVAARLYSNGGVAYSSQPVCVSVRHGFPVLSLPLPSKRESCDFTVRPYLQTVGDFLQQVKQEDRGIESASVYSVEGVKLAQSTGMDIILQDNFDLKINDMKYRVEVPEEVKFPLDGEQSLSDIRNLIHKLYASLNVDGHQLSKELQMKGQLQQLQGELAPLESERQLLAERSERRTTLLTWGGMAFLSLQFGFFARLTWWEYSWDIMEPVTYFVTFGTSCLMFAYFVLTRREYAYPNSNDRQFLNAFHKIARRQKFDVHRYNHLKDTIAQVETDLGRLHDPLQLNLPTPSPPSPPSHNE